MASFLWAVMSGVELVGYFVIFLVALAMCWKFTAKVRSGRALPDSRPAPALPGAKRERLPFRSRS